MTIEFASEGVDIVPGKAVRISVVCHAVIHPDYIRPRSYDDSGDGLTVAAHVQQIVKETIASGLGVSYLDGSGHGIYSDAEWEWEASYTDVDPDRWIARGGGEVKDR